MTQHRCFRKNFLLERQSSWWSWLNHGRSLDLPQVIGSSPRSLDLPYSYVQIIVHIGLHVSPKCWLSCAHLAYVQNSKWGNFSCKEFDRPPFFSKCLGFPSRNLVGLESFSWCIRCCFWWFFRSHLSGSSVFLCIFRAFFLLVILVFRFLLCFLISTKVPLGVFLVLDCSDVTFVWDVIEFISGCFWSFLVVYHWLRNWEHMS